MYEGSSPSGCILLRNMNNAIYIVFDDRHKNYARACLNSIAENYPRHPTLLIVYDGSDKEFLSYLSSLNNALLLRYTPQRLRLRMPKEISSEKIFAKFDLWSDAFGEFDDILCIDADTLVLKPLDDLFKGEFFITGNNLNFPEARVFHSSSRSEKKIWALLLDDCIHYPDKKNDMANAGVFVLPKKYRTKNVLGEIRRIAFRYGDYIAYADQSVLSLWCLKNGIPFSTEFRYNFQVPFFDKLYRRRYPEMKHFLKKDLSFLEKVYILHFSGVRKPDTPSFQKWALIGRYGKDLAKLYNRYFTLR